MTSAMFAHWISSILLLFGTNQLGIRGEHHCAHVKEAELTMTDDIFGPSNMAQLQNLLSNCVDGGCKIETTIYSTHDVTGGYCNHHSIPCQHGGTCLNNDTHPYYTCNCTDGNYGKNCSQNYCEHHPNACQHNGTCLNNGIQPYYTCNCTDGYYGKNCSKNYCEQHKNACQHNGTCLNDITQPYYTCDCTDGYYGNNCSGDYCNYHLNPCQHNGTCLNNNTKPYFSCNCTGGYYGKNCSQQYCEHHPNTCQHNGTCQNINTHPYHTCNCTDGNYGKNCSQNYCNHHPNTCLHNGTCLNNNIHPYHTCDCTDGYYGKNCSQNFCEHHPNVCQHNGTCLKNDTQPYHTCNCTDGYYGENCSQNYCEHHPNVCQPNGTCLSKATPPYHSCNCTEGYYGKNCSRIVRSCEDAQSALARNDSGGVFKLDIPEVGIKNVFCDVTDDGGNWTVFQRRMNGAVDFNRGWDDYVKGFGDLQGDHWLGLEALHQLTKTGNMEMKIKMTKKDGVYWVANYSPFCIGPRSDNYKLHVSGFSGNATYNGLSYNNNPQFSTKDADHDGASRNCDSHFEAGWWYGFDDGCDSHSSLNSASNNEGGGRCCARSNLNGNFNKPNKKGIWWGSSNNLRFSEMKFRKRL